MAEAQARIMVVEDEGTVGMEISESLEDMGYTVPVVAMSGNEAVQRVADTHVDLVLMDIHLGKGIDGIEAAKAIQSTMAIPIVYLTAFADKETIRRTTETEAGGYVVKPFNHRELDAAIQTALATFRKNRTRARQRDRLLSLMKSLQEGVIAVDMNGKVLYMNATAQRVTGQVIELARTRHLDEVFRPVNTDCSVYESVSLVAPLFEGETVTDVDATIERADGEELLVNYSVTPLRNLKGVTSGAILIFR